MITDKLYTSWNNPQDPQTRRYEAHASADGWYGYYAHNTLGNIDGKSVSFDNEDQVFCRLLTEEKHTRIFRDFMDNNALTEELVSTAEALIPIMTSYSYALMLAEALNQPETSVDALTAFTDNHVVFRFMTLPSQRQNKIAHMMSTSL